MKSKAWTMEECKRIAEIIKAVNAAAHTHMSWQVRMKLMQVKDQLLAAAILNVPREILVLRYHAHPSLGLLVYCEFRFDRPSGFHAVYGRLSHPIQCEVSHRVGNPQEFLNAVGQTGPGDRMLAQHGQRKRV